MHISIADNRSHHCLAQVTCTIRKTPHCSNSACGCVIGPIFLVFHNMPSLSFFSLYVLMNFFEFLYWWNNVVIVCVIGILSAFNSTNRDWCFEKMALSQVLHEVGLSERWVDIFKTQLGVQSSKGLYNMRIEDYPLLVQFANKPSEKMALQKLLVMNGYSSFSNCRSKQIKILNEKIVKMTEMIEKLKSCKEDNIESFREILLVPEYAWFKHTESKSIIISKLEGILKILESSKHASDPNDLDSYTFVTKVQGCLVLDKMSGLSMKGVFSTNTPATFNVLEYDMLKLPTNVELKVPLRPQFSERKHFSSKEEENSFFDQIAKLGCSLPDTGISTVENWEEIVCTEAYFSTIAYYFVPQASCYFTDHQLILSDSALSHLKIIDNAITKKEKERVIQDECLKFLASFGSHSLRGPFHFGGMYIWKCYSTNIDDLEKLENIVELHNKVIDAQMSMCFDPCYNKTCVTNFDDLPGNAALKVNTFIELITCGGPPRAIGFPDWKNGLMGSNKFWKTIDCGIDLVPVWDILLLNHSDHFTNSEAIALSMKQCWKLQKQIGMDNGIDKRFEDFSCRLDMDPPLDTKLYMILAQKREIERTFFDPRAWPCEYLPYLQGYLSSLTKGCSDTELEVYKPVLKEIVDAFDLGMKNDLFTRDYVKKVFDTDEVCLPFHLKDFHNICKFLRRVLVIFPTRYTTHPQSMLKRTLLVERTVKSLINHLIITAQTFEECLLLTILQLFNYNHDRKKFKWLLNKADVEYLLYYLESCFRKLYLLQESWFSMCSYLFYVNAQISDMMVEVEGSFKSHVDFLQEKLKKVELGPKKVHISLDSAYMEAKKIYQFLKRFELHEYFPKSLSIRDAIQIRGDTLNMSHSEVANELAPNKSTRGSQVSPSQSEFEEVSLTETSVDAIGKSAGDHVLVETSDKKTDVTTALAGESEQVLLKEPSLPMLVMLQKIMSFDSKFRMVFVKEESDSESESESEPEDDEDDEKNERIILGNSVHPIDCLLALFHCSDNFLCQDLCYRLATCQMAVPLILPHPIMGEPTLLLWALRSIVKEFKTKEHGTFAGRIITYPTPFVSFLRLGHHNVSKSETLNGVMNKIDIESKPMYFLHFNAPGCTAKGLIENGLVEISWYLPGNGLYQKAIAFTNLRGDACNPDIQKQVKFLCDISSLHVVFLSKAMMQEDATKASTVALLKQLAEAPGGMILAQTESCRGFKEQIAEHFEPDYFKKKIVIIKPQKSIIELVQKIQSKLKSNLDVAYPPAELDKVAVKHGIAVDEDDVDCLKGKVLMEELYTVIDDFRMRNPSKSHKELLPLQQEHWHKWAALDKEQYRQKKKYEHEMSDEYWAEKEEQQELQQTLTAMEYGKEQRKKMKEIRLQQYPLAVNLNDLMSLFTKTLQTQERNVLQYYMIWLKFKLDDLSRETLPSRYALIAKKRNELSEFKKEQNEAAVQKCQSEIVELDKALINASFGLEHMLREVGQVYEAVAVQDTLQTDFSRVKNLPRVAAQLLYNGFPLELLDGDAAHLPQKWISSVITCLADILKEENDGNDPSIYILSVLGIQSTGKSTLLNTVFGVQFSVGAGRCTRGAFMQLIPVHQSLHKRICVKYFLVIDTEGLRAPELDRLEAREHDNELATFVIGMANLTLINVYGEVSGEIDDILHTAVHAFLRMNQVQLKPCCHIIHQHVDDVGAEEKLMQGRFKTKDNLDKMTQAAAEETGTKTMYTQFTDVIKFDHTKDVSFFPNLTNGKPPMASVSSEYSEGAQQMKMVIISNCEMMSKYQNSTLLSIRIHLENLWKAILQEDFIFTFQNTFEIVAFKTLESKYSDWSWKFRSDMAEWEQNAEKRLCGCSPKDIDDTNAEQLYLLQHFCRERHQHYKSIMDQYFEENKDIMLKWKPAVTQRLQHLCHKLESHAEKHCEVVYQAQKDRAEAENERGRLNTLILEEVHELVKSLGEYKMTTQRLKEIFDQKWKQWMKYLFSKMEPLRPPDIPRDVETSISEFFTTERKFVVDKLSNMHHSKSLREWGTLFLNLTIKKCHIQILQRRMWGTALIDPRSYVTGPKVEDCFPKAKLHSESTFNLLEKHLASIKKSCKNFSPELATQLLRLVQERRKITSEEFQFTDEYEVEMALATCGHALPVFEEMAENFRNKFDPTVYVNTEMKPQFEMLFLNLFQKVDKEKIAAESLYHKLKEPVRDLVLESLPGQIVNEMRGTYSWLGSKKSFIGKIFLEIGKLVNTQSSRKGFFLCLRFITDIKLSFQWWAENVTMEHCNSGSPSRLTDLAQNTLKDTIDRLIVKAKDTTREQEERFFLEDWLKKFYSIALEGNLKISLSQLQMYIKNQEVSSAKFFLKEFINQLEELRLYLQAYFSKIKYSDIANTDGSAHQQIFDMVAGCTEQCPFCNAQCELTIQNHPTDGDIKHTAQHRPQCLGEIRWKKNDQMVLETCPTLVASDYKYDYKDPKGKLYPLKDYKKFHPDWTIPADKSFEVPLFWRWFIALYSEKLSDYFDFKTTNIPKEWKSKNWSEVEQWIRKEYNL